MLDSISVDKVVKFDDLNKEVEETQDPEEAAKRIKQYEDFIKTKNKKIIYVAYHQGQVFKWFKEKVKFATLISELGIHKTTIIFRINVLKLCKGYAKVLKSPIGLGFFKNSYKDIKAICEENEKIFNVERFYLLKLSL